MLQDTWYARPYTSSLYTDVSGLFNVHSIPTLVVVRWRERQTTSEMEARGRREVLRLVDSAEGKGTDRQIEEEGRGDLLRVRNVSLDCIVTLYRSMW